MHFTSGYIPLSREQFYHPPPLCGGEHGQSSSFVLQACSTGAHVWNKQNADKYANEIAEMRL